VIARRAGVRERGVDHAGTRELIDAIVEHDVELTLRVDHALGPGTGSGMWSCRTRHTSRRPPILDRDDVVVTESRGCARPRARRRVVVIGPPIGRSISANAVPARRRRVRCMIALYAPPLESRSSVDAGARRGRAHSAQPVDPNVFSVVDIDSHARCHRRRPRSPASASRSQGLRRDGQCRARRTKLKRSITTPPSPPKVVARPGRPATVDACTPSPASAHS